ncbi:sterol desaturase family protein [Tahibacter amnicola]|uniref:Sterol desaturase family protein n=1 Tax=Tahibacter amnicola TaxID=2976241 RepID=A0ABY6BHZ9_9GAMM|nr:sterol desaturase family protein [Tahibacter amnicola]UXI69414.1 sterol desaturase family protein [Tahibacter amnicola]
METQTVAYREEYRSRFCPPRYRGVAHGVFVAVVGFCMLVAGALLLRPADLLSYWWMVPATFLLANLVEYLTHRHVMHKRVPVLGAMFERHTRRHHRYFTLADIEITGAHDMHAVLFPPVLLGFFSAVALLLSLAVGAVLGRAPGVLFFLVALSYYLAYEVLHLLAHWPLHGRMARSRVIRRLVSHHRAHHAPHVMQRGNFNIVVPLCDWLFRTLHDESDVLAQTVKSSRVERAYEDARATTREGEHGKRGSIQT